ncbi:hypothetical protein [Amycolatopsis plumensis]|uniref:hypothetical protein n=1 Tax=Amycolatopsis plumensis TaxID=236508 RepID=UPI0036130284
MRCDAAHSVVGPAGIPLAAGSAADRPPPLPSPGAASAAGWVPEGAGERLE